LQRVSTGYGLPDQPLSGFRRLENIERPDHSSRTCGFACADRVVVRFPCRVTTALRTGSDAAIDQAHRPDGTSPARSTTGKHMRPFDDQVRASRMQHQSGRPPCSRTHQDPIMLRRSARPKSCSASTSTGSVMGACDRSSATLTGSLMGARDRSTAGLAGCSMRAGLPS